MFNFLPRSLWFFVATAVIFLLQTSPLPGLYLLLLGAPLWSIATINAGFIFLGIEAVAGKTSKVWLVAPLAWFLGYGYVAWESHRTMKVLEQQVSAFNGQRRVAFDPVKQSLAIDSDFYLDNDFVQTLLEGYDLQVVYVANRGSQPVTHTAWRVSRTEDCMSIDDSHRFKTTIHGVPLEAHYGLYPQSVANTCFYHTSEEPPSPAVTYSATAPAEKRLGYLEYSLDVVTLRDDGGSAEFQSVSATPYTWYPAPVMGCVLNSGNPSWDCHATFLKGRSVWVVAKPADTVAEVLGLKPLAPITAAVVQRRQTDQANTSLDAFNAFLADSSKPVTAAKLRNLAGHPDLYGAKDSEIVAAIGTMLTGPEQHLEIAANLGELLAGLPDAQFAAIAPRLLEVYSAAPQLNMDVIWDHMAFRLGDLGEPALPVLDRLAFEHKEPWSRPIYALCRVGVSAARDGERIAEHLQGTLRSDDEHLAAFKTLLRLGRGDLLANEPDAQSQYRSDDYKLWRRTISPSSPSEACTDRR